MKTFKQFIQEEDRKVYAKKIVDAPTWSPSAAEGDYRIGNITFSAKDGLGAVTMNQNVFYMGFVGMVKPSVFLELALPHGGFRDEDSINIEKLIKDGYALGIPFFMISLQDVEDGKGIPDIRGHEGRARMLAIKRINGDKPVPVHFFLTGGLRSRDLNAKMIKALKTSIRIEQSNSNVVAPIEQIMVDGKIV